jgi:hypothetical protein
MVLVLKNKHQLQGKETSWQSPGPDKTMLSENSAEITTTYFSMIGSYLQSQ